MNGPRPLLGALLGAALGLEAVLLLWQLAVFPPDRLMFLGLPAVVMVGAAWATSLARPPARRQFVAVAIVAGILGVGALTGLPEWQRGGSLSGPCVLRVAASGATVPEPAGTSALSPWHVPLNRALAYDYAVAAEQPVVSSATGLTLAGVNTVLMREVIDTGAQPFGSGDVHLGDVFADLRATVGYHPHGLHHVFVTVDAGDASCELQAYVAVAPAHPWDGPVLVTLWALATATAAGIVVVSLRLRRRHPQSPRSPS